MRLSVVISQQLLAIHQEGQQHSLVGWSSLLYHWGLAFLFASYFSLLEHKFTHDYGPLTLIIPNSVLALCILQLFVYILSPLANMII